MSEQYTKNAFCTNIRVSCQNVKIYQQQKKQNKKNLEEKLSK